MPSAFDGLPRTQIGTVQFPADHEVDGEYREHVFEYPHADGGDTEPLGRKLYVVTLRANFQATFTKYPDLYPNGMNTVRRYFEAGQIVQFTHPTIGTFPVRIIRWRQVKNSKTRSGEMVDITVREQQQQTFVTEQIVSADDTAIGPTMAQLNAELANIKKDLTLTQNDVSALDALQSAVNAALAVRDTTEMVGNLYASNLQTIVGLCQQLDAAASMQDPRAWPAVVLILTLIDQAQSTLKDLHSKQAELREYVVPRPMSVLDLALLLYNGDASRQGDLISLNSDRVDDWSRIPVNTEIRYYAMTAQERSAA